MSDKGQVEACYRQMYRGMVEIDAAMTHEGSGLGSCERDLRRICSGATFGKGLAVHGADASRSERTVAAWARQAIE